MGMIFFCRWTTRDLQSTTTFITCNLLRVLPPASRVSPFSTLVAIYTSLVSEKISFHTQSHSHSDHLDLTELLVDAHLHPAGINSH